LIRPVAVAAALVIPSVPAGPAFAGEPVAAHAAVERLIASTGAEVSVAFRTLDGKDELLLRPDVPFHAASTMKVPVMIELFAQARKGRLGLDDPLSVKNTFPSIVDGSPYSLDPSEDSDPEIYKSVGGTLSLRQLCEAMITVSSNLAANLLIEKLGVANIRQRVRKLGADGMNLLRGVEDGKAFQRGINNTTTARARMVLLDRVARGRAVDAASDREMVLILARQRFGDAIPAGLPPATPVAHKTGSITRIHHDAAIVYAPRPFVLVVLVRGLEDQKQSAALIAGIARALYALALPGVRPDPRP
jgi:beta-lactamase class A